MKIIEEHRSSWTMYTEVTAPSLYQSGQPDLQLKRCIRTGVGRDIRGSVKLRTSRLNSFLNHYTQLDGTEFDIVLLDVWYL